MQPAQIRRCVESSHGASSSIWCLRGDVSNLTIAINRRTKTILLYQEAMVPNNPLGDQLIRASIALGVVATTAVILRFIARSKSKADFGSEDIMIAICLIPQWAMVILNSQGLSTLVGLR